MEDAWVYTEISKLRWNSVIWKDTEDAEVKREWLENVEIENTMRRT